MFICNKCIEEKFENNPTISRSIGKCEICGNIRECSDIPSDSLFSKQHAPACECADCTLAQAGLQPGWIHCGTCLEKNEMSGVHEVRIEGNILVIVCKNCGQEVTRVEIKE